ncbi:hypothetical protein PILCRDRAFT_811973 [Piloderma croceum F 1598]|uniref:Uncharacterized protein n=1 Tax=Piloderma croceum (strain F 1598) TaxID=765440 RepID=A0A0C3CKQ8_PILCF|nr:hypothetical protein PILCRDRAFT_811973 [Piloderma croceum F 1598]
MDWVTCIFGTNRITVLDYYHFLAATNSCFQALANIARGVEPRSGIREVRIKCIPADAQVLQSQGAWSLQGIPVRGSDASWLKIR